MSDNRTNTSENETAIRQLIEDWAAAVRNRDIEAILAHHSDNIVMYDVPKPFQSVGIEAYRKTWDMFFACTKSNVFDIQELNVINAPARSVPQVMPFPGGILVSVECIALL